jgi:hypothetical protein
VTFTLDHEPIERDAPSPRARPTGATSPVPGADAPVVDRPERRRLRWHHEVVVVGVFYAIYSFVRGQFGSASASAAQAASNAQQIIGIERALGIYNELAVQQWFLATPALVRAVNVFYGLFHFVAPIAVLVLLYRRAPSLYRRGRNTLAATTALALIGFCLYPLMPPRLLCDCPLGSGTNEGFVDTLTQYGGLWSFGSHGVGAVSNQYAAMPSLHFAWALYCAVTLRPLLRRRWSRLAVAAYPFATLVAIVATANHFWLDAVAGAVVYGAGSALVSAVERFVKPSRASGGEGVDQREDSVQSITGVKHEALR